MGVKSFPGWTRTISVGKNIREFYPSLGNVTLTGANTIATLLDGPEKVVRYGNLVLGDGATVTSLTASNRCKGLTIICDNLTIKSNATLHMNGKGARVFVNDDPFFPWVNFAIPDSITLSSSKLSLAAAKKIIRDNGFAVWDRGTFEAIVAALFGFSLTPSGGTVLLTAGNGGAGGNYTYDGEGVGTSRAGNAGAAGTQGNPGGGGGGAAYASGAQFGVVSSGGGTGCPYSGGSGGGGVADTGSTFRCISSPGSKYSGPGGTGGGGGTYSGPGCAFMGEGPGAYSSGNGGGAGNPGGLGGVQGGSGTGGKLTIICYGVISVLPGGKIQANGVQGGSASYGGGGGSGGGHISLIYPSGGYNNAGTVQASGGAGGTGGAAGGAGGAGCVLTKIFTTDMGWN